MEKNPPAVQETQVLSLDRENPLEEEMATHSNILFWRIPWTEETGGLSSLGSQRVGYDWVTNAFYHFLFCLDMPCGSAWSYGTKVVMLTYPGRLSVGRVLWGQQPRLLVLQVGNLRPGMTQPPQSQTQWGLASWDPIRCPRHCCTQHVHHLLPKPLGLVAKDMADFFFQIFFFDVNHL